MGTEPTPGAVTDDVPSRLATRRGKTETVAILAVFALYATFLLKLLLFSRAPGSERSVNLVPFATIAQYVFSHSSETGRSAFANVAGNILVFIPLGAYVAWLRRRAAAWLAMLAVASVSIAVEIIQGVLAVGASDVDDVILNTLGGLIGILVFRMLSATMREPSRVRSAMAVLSLLTAPVWGYFLFAIRLRM